MSANIILSTYCNVLWLHHINHQDNSPAYRIDWWFLTGGDFTPHPGNIWQCLKSILYNHGECSWHLVGPEAGVLLASNSAQDIQQCTGQPLTRKPSAPNVSSAEAEKPWQVHMACVWVVHNAKRAL